MATPFLSLNNRVGPPFVNRVINATATTQGVTFGTTDDNTGYAGGSVNDFMNLQPSVVFEGDDNFYAVVGNAVYQSTDAGATWSSVQTLTNLAPTVQSMKTGLYVLYALGIPRLVVVYVSSTGDFYADVSLDGTTWTSYGPFTPVVPQQSPLIGGAVFQGKLYTLQTNAAGATSGMPNLAVFNPGTNTISFGSYTSPGGNYANLDLCVFNNNLYTIIQQPSIPSTDLYQIVGTTFVPVIVAMDTCGVSLDINKMALFVQGSFLYALFFNNIIGSWKCYEINSALVATDITATVIPPVMTIAGLPTVSSRVGILVDGVTSPGSAPNIYIFYATSGGATSWDMFLWNGNAVVMSLVDSGSVASDAMPFNKEVQGSTFWTSAQIRVDITSRISVSGGFRYTFRLYGTSAAGAVSVRGWRASALQEYPVTAATLSSPSNGTMSGNTNITLTADNGATAYEITWNFVTDGFTAGDYGQFYLEQF